MADTETATGFWVDDRSLRSAGRHWEELEELVRRGGGALADARADGLPAAVHHTAARFVQAWSGYAEERALVAAGLAEDLVASAQAYADADAEAAGHVGYADRIAARLGPGR